MKKYIKVTLIIFIIFCVEANVYTQSRQEKYWFYRYRLRNYFVDIGEGIGKSVVIDTRNIWARMNLREDGTTKITNSGLINTGDEGIDLGYYLAILATEAYQLRNTKRDMTLTELYYAIKAFERLDLCEEYPPWNETSKLDGFFMRSDPLLLTNTVSPNYDNLNNGLTEDQGVGSQPPGMPTFVNQWRPNNEEADTDLLIANAMSTDQAVFILMGMAFVNKFVGNVSFYNTITKTNMSFNFRSAASDNIQRVGTYIANINKQNGDHWIVTPDIPDGLVFLDVLFGSRFWLNLIDETNFSVDGRWTIFNPNGDTVGNGGHYPAPMSYGIKEVVNKFNGEHTNINSWFYGQDFIVWKAIPTNFNAVIPLIPGFPPFKEFPGNYYNRLFMACAASLTKSWDFPPYRTTEGFIDKFLKDDHELLYMLIQTCIFDDYDGGDRPVDFLEEDHYNDRIFEILNSAPACGPYNYSIYGRENVVFDYCGCEHENMAPAGWDSPNYFRHNKWIRDGAGSYENPSEEERTGVFSGIDYMLLYALFREYRSWWFGEDHINDPFRNMIYSEIEQSYPYEDDGNDFGTINNPANLRAFETIKYNGQIGSESNNDGSLNLIAGKNISLTPGFHVYQGSTFNAKIEEYNCYNDQYNKSDFVSNNYVENSAENYKGYKFKNPISLENSQSNNQMNSDFNIFPNPTNSVFRIRFSSTNHDVFKIILRNSIGVIVLIGDYYQDEEINVSNLSKGLYIVEIQSKDHNGFDNIIIN